MSDLRETFIFSHFWTQSQGGRAERDSFLVVTSCVAPSSNTRKNSPPSSSAPSNFFLLVQDYLLQHFFEIETVWKLSLRNLLKELWCSHTMECHAVLKEIALYILIYY